MSFGWQMLLLNLWNGLKIWILNISSKFELKKFELKKFFINGVQMFKYERIFNFKPCVYLAYFRSYSHLKIVKCNRNILKIQF